MPDQKAERGQSFLKGTMVLTAATFVVKFINVFYSIPLSNFLGAEGMGHFNKAYDIFIVFSVVASSGTPVAISRMVSMAYANGRHREADKIFKVSFMVFSTLGILGSVIMAVFSAQFSIMMTGQDKSMYAIMALSPMVYFMSLCSCLRGYFQGRSDMVPTAVSQVIESVIKLVVGFGLAVYLMQTTDRVELGAAGAIIGVSFGSLCCVVYILLYKRKKNRTIVYDPGEEPVSETRSILRNIVVFAVPIILGSAFISVLDMIDGSVASMQLQNSAGYTYVESVAMYGWLGNARKLFDLPNAVITPISLVVLPMLAGVIAKEDQNGIREVSTLSIRMTLMVAAPAAVGLCIFAQPICELYLFNQPEFAAGTYPLLAIMAPSVVMASLLYTTNAMIQAEGSVRIPMINMAIGTIIRIFVCYVLTGIREVGIMGTAIASVVGYLVMILLNLYALHRVLPSAPGVLRLLWRPVLASLIMGAVSYLVYWALTLWISPKIAVILAVLVAIVVYVFAAILTKAITRDEVVRLPKGERIADWLRL